MCSGVDQVLGEGPAYVAVTSKPGVEKALEQYGDSTIGVMDKDGNIVKPSTRR